MRPLYTLHSDCWLGCVLPTLQTNNNLTESQASSAKSSNQNIQHLAHTPKRINRGRPPPSNVSESGTFFPPTPSDNLKNCIFLWEYKRFSILYMQKLAIVRALLLSLLARSRKGEGQIHSACVRCPRGLTCLKGYLNGFTKSNIIWS